MKRILPAVLLAVIIVLVAPFEDLLHDWQLDAYAEGTVHWFALALTGS